MKQADSPVGQAVSIVQILLEVEAWHLAEATGVVTDDQGTSTAKLDVGQAARLKATGAQEEVGGQG